MSKVLRVVAIVAAVVATAAAIASGFGAPAILGMSMASIAAVASAVATVAALGAQMLQKPPDMKGTVNEVLIGANMPVPYGIGRSFLGGMKVYDDSSNAPGGSPNKDRHQVFVYSHAGPIDSFEKFLGDYSPINFSGSDWTVSRVANGYYGADGGYLWLQARLGNRPETALASHPGRTSMRNWGANSKLSGMAAATITMEFDEEGERYAGGIPAFGMVAKWVKVYDPRKDSTYPGGSGSHRWADEASWEWSENPGLHALTYARGRFMGPDNVKVVGPGIPQQFIDIPAFVELANVCDANGWTCGGAVYEGPGVSRWDILKTILASGAARPAWVGGMLTCEIAAPKVALATITSDDLADGDIEVQAMQSFKDRHNTIVPRIRSEAHRWEYVQIDAVSNATYVTEDGETKTDEIQYDLCQDKDQGAQLAAYTLADRREFGPIKINCKPNVMGLKPGEAVTLDIEEAGLSGQLAVIEARSVDPVTGSVQLTLRSETTAKHAWALGLTGDAPPTPSLVPPEDVDAAVADLGTSLEDIQTALRATVARGLTVDAIDAGSSATIRLHGTTTADPFILDYPGAADPSIPATSITGLAYSTGYYVYADVDEVGDATPTFGVTTTYADAINSAAHPYRIDLVRFVTTPASGAGTSTGGGTGGGGGGGFSRPGGLGTEYA